MWRGVMAVVMVAGIASGANPRETIRWGQPVEIATGGGVRGPWQQNDSVYDFVDDPSVALEPGGDAAVVWVDQARKDVFWQVFGPDGKRRLPQAVDISRTPAEFSWLPRIALSPRDPQHVYVLWQEIVFSGGPHGGEIYFSRSLDGGRTFEAPRNLTRSIAGEGKGRFDSDRWHNGSLDITVGGDGVIYTAWTDYEGVLTLRRSRDAGKTFEPPVIVAADKQRPARAPSIAVSGGKVCVAWTIGEDENADIRVASSRDGKVFSPPGIVERSQGYADSPKVAFDRQGMLHLAYAEAQGGPLKAAEVRYAQSSDCKTFGRPRVLSGGDAAGFPSLAVDGDRVVVTWEHGLPAHGLGIAYSDDRGARFAPPAQIPGTADRGPNGGAEGRLTRKLAVRGDSIVVVNSARREGESSRVWLVRGTLPARPAR